MCILPRAAQGGSTQIGFQELSGCRDGVGVCGAVCGAVYGAVCGAVYGEEGGGE